MAACRVRIAPLPKASVTGRASHAAPRAPLRCAAVVVAPLLRAAAARGRHDEGAADRARVRRGVRRARWRRRWRRWRRRARSRRPRRRRRRLGRHIGGTARGGIARASGRRELLADRVVARPDEFEAAAAGEEPAADQAPVPAVLSDASARACGNGRKRGRRLWLVLVVLGGPAVLVIKGNCERWKYQNISFGDCLATTRHCLPKLNFHVMPQVRVLVGSAAFIRDKASCEAPS